MQGRRPTHRNSASLLIGAWVFTLRFLTFVTTLGLLVTAVATRDPTWLMGAGVGFLLWLGFSLLHAVEGATCRCALCTGSLFGVSKNTKHVRARHFLGSYRLRNSLQVVFTLSYRCPHCGTRIGCQREEPEPAPSEEQVRSHVPRRASIPPKSVIYQTRIHPPKGH